MEKVEPYTVRPWLPWYVGVQKKYLNQVGQRPTWDESFMMEACLAALRATCLKRHVGAVAVKERHLIATGYNGSPAGHPHCLEEGCEIIEGKCERTTHGEANLVASAASLGVSLKGSTVYVCWPPCDKCVHLLIGAGVVEVVYLGELKERSRYLLDRSKILHRRLG